MELSRYGAITSVVVSRGGEIVTEQYAEGDADTLRKIRSCTKTVAGMLTGIAIERGIVPGVETTILGLLGADDIDRRKRRSACGTSSPCVLVSSATTSIGTPLATRS